MKRKNVLLIGTGEAAALIAKPLNNKDKKFSVTSMTIERATGLVSTLAVVFVGLFVEPFGLSRFFFGFSGSPGNIDYLNAVKF